MDLNTKKQQVEDCDEKFNRLMEWLIDENREPAKTKFTAGALRNLAREIEFAIFKAVNK
jgi:hypothetical protein